MPDDLLNEIELLENDPHPNFVKIFKLNKLVLNKLIQIGISGSTETRPFKWDDLTSSFSQILECIEPNSIILEYTSIADYTYCLSLTRKGAKVNRIGKTKEIKEISINCKRKLQQYNIGFNELFSFSQILLQPIEKIPSDIKKIIVIKDDSLLSVPFELLLLDKPQHDYKNNHYLILDYEITYAYSISMIFRKLDSNIDKSNYDFIGFAPTEPTGSETSQFSILNNSFPEISYISDLFLSNSQRALCLYGIDANADNFCRYSSMANILHIATHTVTSKNDLTSLYFSSYPDSISSKHIDYYNILDLFSCPKLVVLASCSSYSGRSIDGEGIQNIGRAFSLNGSTYVISSLYRLDDEFSYRFMSRFYEKLLKTNNITKSLCESKREFAKDPKYSYPTYWSNYILTGK
jgi:CHAT domain-containing protein